MSINEFKIGDRTIIINGGDGFDDCPKSWDEAESIQKEFNKPYFDKYGEELEYGSIHWRFDCGYKLDFDGGLVNISSRFYPPKTGYGKGWDGGITVYVLNKQVIEKAFKCDTLKDLKEQVDLFISTLTDKIKNAIL